MVQDPGQSEPKPTLEFGAWQPEAQPHYGSPGQAPPLPASNDPSKSKKKLLLILGSIGAFLLLCCSGLCVVGALAGPSKKASTERTTSPASTLSIIESTSPELPPTPTESPSAEPSPTAVPTTVQTTQAAPPPPPPPTTEQAPPPPPPPPADDVYYPNCAAVKAAGKAPLYRGQPGYRSGLDRDGDGVACEK